MARIRTHGLLFGALLAIGSVTHGASLDELDPHEDVQARLSALFDEAVAEYGEKINAQPGNVVLALKRCSFMQTFEYYEDFYIEGVDQAVSDCFEELSDRYPKHPEIELARLDNMYGEEAIDAALAFYDGDFENWNTSQRSRLLLFLAERYSYDETTPAGGGYQCLEALKLDLAAHCRLLASENYNERGDRENAIAVLSSPLDPHDDNYYLLEKITALSDLGAHDAVAEVFSRLNYDELEPYDLVDVAGELARANMPDEAIKALDDVPEDYWQQDALHRAKYEVALTLSDPQAALGHYNNMRDEGIGTDPLLRTRFELAAADFGLPWRLRDALGLLAILASILAIAAVTVVVPSLVHYRSLVRQTKGMPAGIEEGRWKLRHTWYVLFSMTLASLFASYLFAYEFIGAYFEYGYLVEPELTGIDLSSLYITDSIVLATLLLPLIVRRRRWTMLGAYKWTVGRSLGLGFLFAIALRLLFAIPAVLWPDFIVLGDALTNSLAIGHMLENHGVIAALLLIALAVPILEETVFRGVLLQGFAQNISFRGANILQSLIFAGLHEGLILMPFYFVFAYVAGNVTRKAGGLLPVIVMHAVFNGGVILAAGFLINASR